MKKFAARTLLSAMLFTLFHAQANSDPVWNSINGQKTYEIQANGDAVKTPASISVTSSGATQYGGAIQTLDVSAQRGKTAILAGDLRAEGQLTGVAIWMRIEGDAPLSPSESFATSAIYPISMGGGAQHRQVQLSVPATARRILFGLVLSGRGKVDARNLSLQFQKSSSAGIPKSCDVYGQADSLVKQHALFVDKVDTTLSPAEKPTVRPPPMTSRDVKQDHTKIRQLLFNLGDRHSRLLTPEEGEQFERSTYSLSVPQVQVLTSGIVYIKVPAILGRDRKSALTIAKNMDAEIARHASDASKGWIVDLRGNSGGNMWPMLAGLHSLLGSGRIGSFQDRHGKISTWSIPKASAAGSGSPEIDHAPVAVLVDEHTASSGEAVAVAFHGRDDTRLFGRPTAGLSTGNTSFTLCDGSILMLTTTRFVDRNGSVFGEKIIPDVVIEEDRVVKKDTKHPVVGKDDDVNAAINWLSKK